MTIQAILNLFSNVRPEDHVISEYFNRNIPANSVYVIEHRISCCLIVRKRREQFAHDVVSLDIIN